MQDRLRRLPKVQSVLDSEGAAGLIAAYGYDDVANAVRAQVQEMRDQILSASATDDAEVSIDAMLTQAEGNLANARVATLRPVINATGIIIHTNLGRARLAPEAIDAMQEVALNYSTLELDIETGKRGSRHAHVEDLICQLTGAEAAIVVNNCAAAILTSLTALGAGKPIIASRGEMVEIGGSFRMPDVIAQSGCVLHEVGTTNKTHLRDYETAIREDTALLLKSHTSNYAVVGFASAPKRKALADLAHKNETLLVEDLGSGVLVDLSPYGLPNEPIIRDVLSEGVNLVTFSGDKLLGGPQAGIIAGRRDCVDQIRAHPMARAVRIDKLSLAALHATLDLYRAPNNPFERIPVLQALAEPIDCVHARATLLSARLSTHDVIKTSILQTAARAGGGALPQQDLPSFAVALAMDGVSPDQIARRLRSAAVPVLGRISNDQFLLDMRAITNADMDTLSDSVTTTLTA
ncbi:MAG: L-seryl-tRNA(Sec) selenium transferase [Henriciella sp.]|nr:L-seryl-tRNA(Sec) selenium transferase [Henriciella sp.]